MLKNHTVNLEELEKNVEQLLKDALGEQKITIRRVGVKVSELSEVQDQSNITSYF
jgi:DNA polymerase IV (DinB-like DNA polymerase)